MELEHLRARLEALPPSLFTEGPASVIWPLESSQVFSVRSLRLKLIEEKFHGIGDFPHDSIWSTSVPSKVQCFCWMVYFKKIATIDNLQRRGMQMVNRCVLCGCDLESVDHLFLHCKFTSAVWAMITSALSIYGPGPLDCTGLLMAWKGMNCLPHFAACMKVILHAFFWEIWRERNNKIFRDEFRSSCQLFYRVMISAGNWLSVAGLFTASQHQDWVSIVFDPG
ncbi:hypothetical protein LINGRAHAP2_LOCUS28402 [Linum grandiflorum]